MTQQKSRVPNGEHRRWYAFSEHSDRVLMQPERGKPKMDWIIGVRANGQYVEHEWDDTFPHLLITGKSGSGKSAAINSMLCQIMHNCHPDDVNFWLADPKNELGAYRHVKHVQRLVDPTTVQGSRYAACAALLGELQNEMKHRYKSLACHLRHPQELSEAREIAKGDPGGSEYLNFPYIFLVIEECSDYFAPPADKMDKEAYSKIRTLISHLARDGCAVGIHIVIATLEPVEQNFFLHLKEQCRHIVLERKGCVTVLDGKPIADLRGLLLVRRENADDPVDERGDILALLPKS